MLRTRRSVGLGWLVGLTLGFVPFVATPRGALGAESAPGPSLRVSDLLTLAERCGAAEPNQDVYAVVRQHALAGAPAGGVLPQAFEEHKLFNYALANGDRGARRFLLLKPATFIVEDLVRAPAAGQAMPWALTSEGAPSITPRRIRVTEAGREVVGECLLPARASLVLDSLPGADGKPATHRVQVIPAGVSGRARLLHVFHLGGKSGADAAAPPTIVVEGTEREDVRLTVTSGRRVFRLTLPADPARAGRIEIAGADGTVVLPRRLLPSSVMPHGPDGARLLERWDAPYRGERMPGWDVGRPSTHLVAALKGGTLRAPGRAIVLGCGTGTNAIHLAKAGFDVVGVDVAPTALRLAEAKAKEAGVRVRWMVADVVTLPRLEPFDVIFDRGCYHHVRKYNAAGFVETIRRLSRPGTRFLLLAGSSKQAGRGGPPRTKEEEIRADFSKGFEIEWLREIRFDRRDGSPGGALAWSTLVRRKP